MNKAEILEQIEQEKASLRRLATMFEELTELKQKTERRIKEWEEIIRSLDK